MVDLNKAILEAKIPIRDILAHMNKDSTWLAKQLEGTSALDFRLEQYVKNKLYAYRSSQSKP